MKNIKPIAPTLSMFVLLACTLSACRIPSPYAPTQGIFLPSSIPSSYNPTQVPSHPSLRTTLTPPVNDLEVKPVVHLPLIFSAPGPTIIPLVDTPPAPAVTATAVKMSTPALTGSPAPITLLFTGVIVPARCVQLAIDTRGDANYVYDEVRELISGADLAVGTLNTTFSDLSEHTGCIVTYVLVSDSRSAVAAAQAGFDVMSVATNHIMNCSGASCGDNYNHAFFDTLDNLKANQILPVGAGMNLAEALQPVVVEVKGVRFGIVSLGMVDAMRYAEENGPGIARLTDENLQQTIVAARKVSDVVIVMPHWGPEDTSEPSSYQLHYARVAVAAGADVVVGNHTHVVQAIQQINGIDVFYGLGNFVFDQNWDLAHQQGVILQLHFSGKQYTGYELIPTHVDGDGTVHIAGEEEAAEIIKRIVQASDRLR
jgi:hypothetical protein